MIKAKKGLLITLFAALMIFAFGATSVFASTTDAKATFSPDYTKVTITGCTEADEVYNGDYDTTFTFWTYYDANQGKVRARLDDSAISGFPSSLRTLATAYFYDLSVAEFATGNNNNQVIKPTYMKPSDWAEPTGLRLHDPTGANNTTYFRTWAQLSSGDWKVEAEVTPEFDVNATEDQVLTVALKEHFEDVTPKTLKYGTVAPMTVTVKGYAAGDPTKALFFMDEVDPAATVSNTSVAYDGAEHTVVMKDVKGYTVKYQTYNTTSGNWDDVDAIKIKEVGSISAKAQLYDAKGEKATGGDYSFTVSVTALNPIAIGYGFPKTTDAGQATYYVEGTEYDAYSFIDVDGIVDTFDAAVAANKADLIALFKEAYDVNAKVSKDDTNKITLTIAAKSGIDAAALVKKYEAVCKSFNITAADVQSFALSTADLTNTATVFINAELIDEEIEFIDTPTAVTYKAKKLKKKAASFTVTAVSNKGRVVSYKLINAPAKIKIDKATGEITLNKGLKKGKYKVTVKAYIPGSPLLFETQDILIKVKK